METFDELAARKLHLTPRTNQELHSVLTSFELKWQDKARRVLAQDGRISRF